MEVWRVWGLGFGVWGLGGAVRGICDFWIGGSALGVRVLGVSAPGSLQVAGVNIIFTAPTERTPSRGSASNDHPVVATMIYGGLEAWRLGGLEVRSLGFGVWGLGVGVLGSGAPLAGILYS